MFDLSAMHVLLGGDFSLVESHGLSESHDKLLNLKTDLFDHPTRWKILFQSPHPADLFSFPHRGSPSRIPPNPALWQ